MGGGAASKTSDKLKSQAKDLHQNADVNRAIAGDNWDRGNYGMAAAGYASATAQDAQGYAYDAAGAAAGAAEKVADALGL